ncbi:hypothetical protein [Luteimonas panaciterrae]|uniref:hypothetical protein n=1 Tax=Luteimonas panaciterrae TaxID=363885 RepID=UPI001CFC03CC|nr:hypothetical protein [Luteimonas panaciterrae]
MRNGDSVVPLGPPLAVADAILALSQAGTGKQKKLARAVADLAKNAPLLEACLVIAQLPKEEQAKAVEVLRKTVDKKKPSAR